MICGKTEKQLIHEIESFHGFAAPGLLIGAFMVDLLYNHIGSSVEADAVVETRHCLPDAVQMLTPCTVGNGWLKIVDFDKFAITMYDRFTLEGYRTWLDLDKTKSHPDIYNWFMGLVSKKDLPIETLRRSIFAAGHSVLSIQGVNVEPDFAKREKKGKIAVCKKCKEAYSAWQGDICLACSGKGYYSAI